MVRLWEFFFKIFFQFRISPRRNSRECLYRVQYYTIFGRSDGGARRAAAAACSDEQTTVVARGGARARCRPISAARGRSLCRGGGWKNQLRSRAPGAAKKKYGGARLHSACVARSLIERGTGSPGHGEYRRAVPSTMGSHPLPTTTSPAVSLLTVNY